MESGKREAKSKIIRETFPIIRYPVKKKQYKHYEIDLRKEGYPWKPKYTKTREEAFKVAQEYSSLVDEEGIDAVALYCQILEASVSQWRTGLKEDSQMDAPNESKL